MGKKRVYELAKEYGIDGPVLAKKLKELGFEKVKTHMTVLDDADIMMIQARLEISGAVPEKIAAPAVAEEATAEAKPKKGAKKKATKAEEEAEAKKSAKKSKSPAKSDSESVEEIPAATVEPAEEAPVAKETVVETPIATEPEPPAAPAPAPAAPAAKPLPPKKPMPEPKPAAPRRTATILGRIDPSLLGPKATPKREERPRPGPSPAAPAASSPAAPVRKKTAQEEEEARIARAKKIKIAEEDSIQEALAEVHPTFEHDPRKALARGDAGTRHSLTASQLKMREEARYQKRREARRGRSQNRGDRDAMSSPSKHQGPITAERKNKIVLDPPVTVKSFAMALGLKPAEVIRKLMASNVMATMNSTLDEETIQVLSLEFGQEVETRKAVDLEEEMRESVKAAAEESSGEDLMTRPPVIAFLGHVDHGKTSLLDAIRKSSVAAGESGGITQHIGAYQVTTEKGQKVTILDTPGHEAFTAMRARGARTTDMVVLVVAADDGVMPQTQEAISHAKAAKVPIIIALNKIDKGDANPQKVRQQLATADLAPEDWGGSTGIVETSATKGTGIQELLDRVLLESEVLDLKANPERPAEGTVLEASITEGKGIVAHLLVQNGTLRKGDVILAGTGYGKVRNMYNDRGEAMDEAGPATPVEVTGLSALPEASGKFYITPDLSQARELAEDRAKKQREMARSERPAVSMENLFERIKSGETREIRLILKADFLGSLEALKKELETLKGKEISINLLHSGIGGINESDIDLAYSSDGIVLGFHVIADEKARRKADQLGVETRTYQIIYEMVEDLRKTMEGMLKPSMREAVTGHATIRAVFKSSKVGNIAGCMVTDGTIARNNPVRLIRDSVVIYSGKLSSLKRMKDDTREVRSGFECGMKIEGYEDIKEGDVIESYEIKEEKRLLV